MKAIKIVTLSLLALVVVLGGGFYVTQKAEQDYMLEVVQSDEAKKVYEETIYHLDPNAFTEEGKILSYKLDLTSIQKNPMGGIFVSLIINGKENYKLRIGLLNDSNTKRLYVPNFSYSKELGKLIEVK